MIIEQRIESRNDVKAIYCRLTGDYSKVDYSSAWGKLVKYCAEKNILNDCEDAEYLNQYLDNPSTTPAAACRVDVCISASVVESLEPSGEVGIRTIEGGKFIVFKVKGPYEQFADVYPLIYGKLLAEARVKVLNKPTFEKYLNDPESTPPEDLLSEIWIPVE